MKLSEYSKSSDMGKSEHEPQSQVVASVPSVKNEQMAQSNKELSSDNNQKQCLIQKTSAIERVESLVSSATGVSVSGTQYRIDDSLEKVHLKAEARYGRFISFAHFGVANSPELICHELVHIAQQKVGSNWRRAPLSRESAELEANQSAVGILNGKRTTIHATGIQALYQTKSDESAPQNSDENNHDVYAEDSQKKDLDERRNTVTGMSNNEVRQKFESLPDADISKLINDNIKTIDKISKGVSGSINPEAKAFQIKQLSESIGASAHNKITKEHVIKIAIWQNKHNIEPTGHYDDKTREIDLVLTIHEKMRTQHPDINPDVATAQMLLETGGKFNSDHNYGGIKYKGNSKTGDDERIAYLSWTWEDWSLEEFEVNSAKYQSDPNRVPADDVIKQKEPYKTKGIHPKYIGKKVIPQHDPVTGQLILNNGKVRCRVQEWFLKFDSLDSYLSRYDDLVKKIKQDLIQLFFEYPL